MNDHPKELMVELFQRLNAKVNERVVANAPAAGVAKPPVVDMGPVMEATLDNAMNEIVARYVGLERQRLGGAKEEVVVDDDFLKRWGPRILAELFSVFLKHAPGADKLMATQDDGGNS